VYAALGRVLAALLACAAVGYCDRSREAEPPQMAMTGRDARDRIGRTVVGKMEVPGPPPHADDAATPALLIP
jgi:hypothetical protein